MEVIGTIPDPSDSKALLPVALVTSCVATYGALVYDVIVNGIRVQVDLPVKSTNEERLNKIAGAYKAMIEQTKQQAETRTVEVPAVLEETVKEFLQAIGA